MKGRFLKKTNRGKRWIISFLSILAAGIVIAPFIWVKSDALVPGVYINGINVGGKNREELESLMADKNEELKKGKLILTRGEVEETLPYGDLHVHYDQSSLQDAMALGRTGNLFEKWYDRWHILWNGQASHMEAVYDTDALQSYIKNLEKTYEKPPHNAYPTFKRDGSVTFSKGRPYLKIKTDELTSSIDKYLTNGESGKMEIPVSEEKDPNMSVSEAKEINRVLGCYSTSFYPEKNRSKNIELAAKSLNGVFIRPGEVFSFNKTTGLRSFANGYLEAPVIINGKLEPGSGGGVCQVSSTLFNAVLLSGLEVTQRTCHYSPVSYVPMGRDATVAEGSLDFCFRNHLKHGVYIYTEYTAGQVTIWILGNENDQPSHVDITQTKEETLPFKTITKIDPSQAEDKKEEPGHEGHNVTIVQKVKWADGRTYQDSFFSDYEAVDTVITYNKDPS